MTPTHNDRLVISILCTLFCCQIGGIIAIVYSAKSNDAYRTALVAPDQSTRDMLFCQSEQDNRTARTWIIISVCCGVVGVLAYIILVSLGIIASIL